MKSTKLFLTAILFFVLGFAKAQNDYNPWKKYGYTPPKALTLSNGKYQEFFDNDTVVQIGSVMFNTVTNQIVSFVVYDTTYIEATLEPYVISRWLSPDPLAKEFPSWSPYNYAENNPIKNIDPDGRFAIPIHAQITDNTAKLNKLTATQTFFLVQGARAADVLGFAETWHFDNKANFAQVNTQWGEINNRISNRSSWDYYGLGADLHNVQDFYSHSNYVELYADYYKQNNDGKMPSSVPTYDEGVKDNGFSEVLKTGLKTGEFSVKDYVVDEKIRGKNMGPDSHQQMNKDDAKGPMGKLAKDVAGRHSDKIVKEFESNKKD